MIVVVTRWGSRIADFRDDLLKRLNDDRLNMSHTVIGGISTIVGWAIYKYDLLGLLSKLEHMDKGARRSLVSRKLLEFDRYGKLIGVFVMNT